MKALSERNDDPKTASRPYDKDRDGFVMGEAAGVVIGRFRARHSAVAPRFIVKLPDAGQRPMLIISLRLTRKA